MSFDLALLTFFFLFFFFFFFFFNDTATTDIYSLSLHDALPICHPFRDQCARPRHPRDQSLRYRSEEHTSELQSLRHLVCRLLLEKKKHDCKVLKVTQHETGLSTSTDFDVVD